MTDTSQSGARAQLTSAAHPHRGVARWPVPVAVTAVRVRVASLTPPPSGFHLCELVAGAIILVLALGLRAQAGPLAASLPVLAYVVLLVAARRVLAQGYPHPTYGACNVVTHLRATAVAGLTSVLALQASPMDGWLVTAVAGAVLALDGVDGWLARRAGRVSDFGARFDMETDAALALLLAALIWLEGLAGAWVLMLGLARYGFAVAGLVWPWLRAALPPRLRRKAGCVVQVGALVLALVPGMPVVVAQGGLMAAAVLLVWSFGADVMLLARARNDTASPDQVLDRTHRGTGDVAGGLSGDRAA